MPTRFEIERAVMASKLGATSRHLMHVLCTKIDAEAHVILARYQPSHNQLARETGWNRSTVRRHLRTLEKEGWIIRLAPTKHDARTKHKRTSYLLLIPETGNTRPGYPQDSGGTRARGIAPRELGAHRSEARGTVPHKSSLSSRSGDEPTPVPPDVKTLCARCSSTRHRTADCDQ